MNTTPQTCPDIGMWRAWLDHEADLPDEARATPTSAFVTLATSVHEAHLEACPGCQRVVDELRSDAAFAGAGLASLASSDVPSAAEVSVARERLHWRHAATHKRSATEPVGRSRLEQTPMIFSRFSTPWRVAAGGVAAAIALTLVVAFTPEGSAAAAGFLAQFRSQQVQAVEITPQSQADISRAIKALGNLGTIEEPSIAQSTNPAAAARAAADQSKTATATEATQTVGFNLLTPDPKSLPGGFSSTPTIRVTPGSQIKFTFDKKKAQTYYQATGHPEVSLPDKFDGATLAVSIPPAAVLSYSGSQGSRSELIVAEAGELVVDTQGNVSLPEMRDFLLGLPGLPPAIVSQLKQIQNWNDTLPIPVPVDQVNWQKTTINGNSALLLNDNSGVGSAVVWHTSGPNGHLIGVAGTLKASDLQKVASTLAER